MKIHGYCTKCHKVKLVNVQVVTGKNVAIGECDDCRDGKRHG